MTQCTEYQSVYTDRGRLRYIPEHLFDSSRAHRCIFQGRHRRPHRIHIAHVAPDPTLLRCQKRKSPSKSSFTVKLASSRDSAKRYLRSFIDSHFTSPAPNAQDVVLPRSSTTSSRSSASPPLSSRQSSATGEMRSSPRNSTGTLGTHGVSLAVSEPRRPELTEALHSSRISTMKNMVNSIKSVPEEKPIATGGGVSVNISLTEPVLFLRGFEHNEYSERSTAMLRGSLNLKITKPTKLKAVTLKFRGKALTKWPEGELLNQPSLPIINWSQVFRPKRSNLRKLMY